MSDSKGPCCSDKHLLLCHPHCTNHGASVGTYPSVSHETGLTGKIEQQTPCLAVLTSPELTTLILGSANLSVRDLYCVSTVCRSLSSPALDRLWRLLDRMANLLRLVPTQGTRAAQASRPAINAWTCHSSTNGRGSASTS
jgi:hypothetical protein